MNKVSMNKLFFLFSAISSLIFCSNVTINEIKNQVAIGIKSAEYNLTETEDAYFSYNIFKLSENKYILLSIHNSGSKKLEIQCLLSTDKTMESDFNTNKSICKQVYESSEYKVNNMLFSFNDTEIKSGSKLFLKINSTKNSTLYLFVRESDAYKEKIEPQNISNSFAYTAFKFEPKNYYNKQYLFTASQNQGFLIYGFSGDKYWEIDETSALPITNQTLAANFFDLDKIIIFAGKFEYNRDMNDTNLNINLTEIKGDTKIYYYTRINTDNYYGFNSFHYECTDNITKHYLIVNYRTLENGEYFYTFTNLIGTSPYLADFPPSASDITQLDYSEAKRMDFFTKKDYSLQVFKLQCSGKGKKIVSNLKYTKLKIKDTVYPGNSTIYDYYFIFEENNTLTLSYSATKYQFAIEIFTQNTQGNENFDVEFENKTLVLNNNKKYIFTRTKTEYTNMIFKANQSISAVISFNPSIKDSESSSTQKYYTFKNYIINDEIYYYYELDHEYNTNYSVSITVNNPTKKVVPFCYYLSTLPVIQNVGQNCILLPANTTQNLTFKNIYTSSEKDHFNVEEPTYSIIMYNNRSKDEYDIKKIDLKTDLPKSTPINKIFNKESLYLESQLKKNEDSFFNLDLQNSSDEYHLDLYILNNVANYKESKLDIKCIFEYEIAIKFIEKLFTEENNICYNINKDDYKSNVSHVIINGVKKNSYHRLIIKLSPKENMNIKFLFNKNEIVHKDYNFNTTFKESIHRLPYPSIYKIYEVNKTNLEAFKSKYLVFYDKEKNGGLEIYTRNEYEFKRIYKDDYFTCINIDEFLSKYNYSKFLFVLGKNDCDDIKSNNNTLKYQIKILENVIFKSISEFKDNYRIPININNCTNKYYHAILNYGKKITKNEILLAEYNISGELKSGKYIDTFSGDDFEKVQLDLKPYQILNDNIYHLNIIKFQCEKNFNAFFDYFSEIGPKTVIKLNEGEIQYFIIRKNNSYTFNYTLIDGFKVEINGKGENPIIYFENELKNIKRSIINFSRKKNDINLFNITNVRDNDTYIRITTLINLENLPKTNLDNLYKKNGTFIYDIPKGALNVSFMITRKSYRLRLLDESQDGVQVCYTLTNTIILSKYSSNCFNLKDKYVLEHDVPKGEGKYYMTLYSSEDNQEFNIEEASSFVKGDEGNSNGGQGNKNEEEKKDDEGGVSWVIILIIILLVLIVIGVAVFIIIRIRKRGVSSKDIERDVNEPSPITDQEMN